MRFQDSYQKFFGHEYVKIVKYICGHGWYNKMTRTMLFMVGSVTLFMDIDVTVINFLFSLNDESIKVI